MNTNLLPVMSLLLLAACSAPDKMAKEVHDSASAPLSDLNLVRAEIPPVLAAAAKAPYAVPESRSCSALTAAIVELDAVLGADLDTPVTAVNPSLIERGINLATDTAARQVRSVTTVVVPYRGWVRRLSGAEKYSREVSAAIASGTVRRAYLKGLGQAENCPAPAAPRA